MRFYSSSRSALALPVALRRSMRRYPVVSPRRLYVNADRVPCRWSSIPRQEGYVSRSLTYTATDPITGSVKYGVEDEGRTMRITWANGETAAYSAVWLRHNCQCSSCLSSSGQKSLDPTILDPRTTVTPRDSSGAASN